MKEESKAQKKIESAFKWALSEANVDHQLPWNEVKEKLDLEAPEFAAVPEEEDRIRIYKVRTDSPIIFIILFYDPENTDSYNLFVFAGGFPVERERVEHAAISSLV